MKRLSCDYYSIKDENIIKQKFKEMKISIINQAIGVTISTSIAFQQTKQSEFSWIIILNIIII